MFQGNEGTAIQEVPGDILKGFLHFAFGKKRALQTVTRVDYKFLLSRIRSIH
jgi:hypothetical protein